MYGIKAKKRFQLRKRYMVDLVRITLTNVNPKHTIVAKDKIYIS
jgi:hypothetical protein